MSSQHQQQNNDDNTTNSTNNSSSSSSSSNGNGVDAVYVLENGCLNDAMIEFNARIIGFNTSTMSYIEEAYLDKFKVTHSILCWLPMFVPNGSKIIQLTAGEIRSLRMACIFV
jgi:hypothetical protein